MTQVFSNGQSLWLTRNVLFSFASLGQKLRAFEPLCLSLPYGLLNTNSNLIENHGKIEKG
jgi:hypothetical protein